MINNLIVAALYSVVHIAKNSRGISCKALDIAICLYPMLVLAVSPMNIFMATFCVFVCFAQFSLNKSVILGGIAFFIAYEYLSAFNIAECFPKRKISPVEIGAVIGLAVHVIAFIVDELNLNAKFSKKEQAGIMLYGLVTFSSLLLSFLCSLDLYSAGFILLAISDIFVLKNAMTSSKILDSIAMILYYFGIALSVLVFC